MAGIVTRLDICVYGLLLVLGLDVCGAQFPFPTERSQGYQSNSMFGVPYGNQMGFGYGVMGPPVPATSYPGGNPMAPVMGARSWLPSVLPQQVTGPASAGIPSYAPPSIGSMPQHQNIPATQAVTGSLGSTGTAPFVQTPTGQAFQSSPPTGFSYPLQSQYPDYRGLSPGHGYTDEGAIVKQIYNQLVSDRLSKNASPNVIQPPSSTRFRGGFDTTGASFPKTGIPSPLQLAAEISTTVQPDISHGLSGMTAKTAVVGSDLLINEAAAVGSTDITDSQSPARGTNLPNSGPVAYGALDLDDDETRKATTMASLGENEAKKQSTAPYPKKSTRASDQNYRNIFDR